MQPIMHISGLHSLCFMHLQGLWKRALGRGCGKRKESTPYSVIREGRFHRGKEGCPTHGAILVIGTSISR